MAIQRENNSRPLKDKGKSPDLRNCGNVNLSDNDLDSEVQCQILEDCNKWQNALVNLPEVNHQTTDKSGTKEERVVIPTDKENKLQEQSHMKRKIDNEIRQLKKGLKRGK